jgi:hypothetical protein
MVNQLFGRAPPVAHDDGIIHRFGRIWAFVDTIDAKAVAAETELGNVTPAVGEKLADANRIGDDLVPQSEVSPSP